MKTSENFLYANEIEHGCIIYCLSEYIYTFSMFMKICKAQKAFVVQTSHSILKMSYVLLHFLIKF